MLKLRPRKRDRSRVCAIAAAPETPHVPEPAQVPEWETEAWKHRVEAEACRRVKREIEGVSRGR
jgi:hypothetical protein